jgi:hypothetical protein
MIVSSDMFSTGALVCEYWYMSWRSPARNIDIMDITLQRLYDRFCWKPTHKPLESHRVSKARSMQLAFNLVHLFESTNTLSTTRRPTHSVNGEISSLIAARRARLLKHNV